MSEKLISIIVPAYNEEGNIEEVHRRITAVMEKLPHDYEVIVIDNHSTDGTQTLCEAICERDPRWRLVVCGEGPMKVTPAFAQAWANSGLSERNP